MATDITKPSLAVATVYFHEEDRDKARELGGQLYNVLTRPEGQPLSYGPGIPVYSGVHADHVDLEMAQVVVLIPVLWQGAYFSDRVSITDRIRAWHNKAGRGRVLPVFLLISWRNEEKDLPMAPLLREITGGTRQQTIDEIVIAIIRLHRAEEGKVSLFLSHAKRDMEITENAVGSIRDYVRTSTTAGAFFDVNEIQPGVGLKEQLDTAIQNSVFVGLRTDGYSTRNWCLEELLGAKRFRVPTITVELLRDGEALSSANAGNSPTVVWDNKDSTSAQNAQRVVSRAFVEYLRALHFHREAERLIEACELPEDTISLCRPPELLDIIQGPVKRTHAEVVIHPDPELPPAIRNMLAKAHPKLRLVTPGTAFRALRSSGSKTVCPLDGVPVGIGISDIHDTAEGSGLTPHHVDDVAVHLARNLIAGGAHLVYAGDFRKFGYTMVFSELVSTYRQTADGSCVKLHCYRPAHEGMGDVPDGLNLELRSLRREPYAGIARLAPPGRDGAPRFPDALYHADMRRVMTGEIAARILIGGQTLPMIEETGQKGYSGLYPGLMEEAWWSLKARQPLYVVGGLGGAAGMVASLMGEGTKEHGFGDQEWRKHASYLERTDRTREALRNVDLDGLPTSIAELASEIQSIAASMRVQEDSWNGLTPDENRELLSCRDPLRIAVLIQRGLTEVISRMRKDKLAIELVNGSVGSAGSLDIVAFPVFEGLPVGGAVVALDQAVAASLSEAHAKGRTLVSSQSDAFPADHVYLASLGVPTGSDTIVDRVGEAAREFAERLRFLKVDRVGTVTFGGSLSTDLLKANIQAMVRGLRPLRGQIQVSWFENDAERYGAILEVLREMNDVAVTTRVVTEPEKPAVKAAPEQLIVTVRWEDDLLHTVVLPPSGTAVAQAHSVPFRVEEMISLSVAQGRVPDSIDIEARGRKLAELLFGDSATDLLEKCRDARMTIMHDIAASQIPFEVLTAGAPDQPHRPAPHRGMSRRLAVPKLPSPRLFPRPPLGRGLNVALVIDPLGDLPAARTEGEAVMAWLTGMANVAINPIIGETATKENFLKAIASADVLHYCGHAYFDDVGDDKSGVELRDGVVTLADLKGVETHLRLAFVNACEAARVRGRRTENPAASFAEYFLRSGIEAFLGTYWPVGDTAAKEFATTVYQELANGKTLDEAVRLGRQALLKINSPEWANYLLYGGGNFRLSSK